MKYKKNMITKTSKTKTIAKNAVYLYIRMIIVTFITLFTSRVVLRELGFEDYGLYNVVGGVVTLFAFLRSSMSSSTQRFLSFEMGRGNYDNLRNIFNSCLLAHLLIAIVLLVLAETIGLWFLNNQIVIPQGREIAANWIYQLSVISLFVGIVSVPYSADIISHEKMVYFAFLGVFNAVLKLIIAYLIIISPIDRLVFYGFLMMFINIVDLVLNWSYCRINFSETHFKLNLDKEYLKKIFSFSSWTIWGQLSIVGANQGTNILVNMFYTVTANAAMGVGSQVNHAITGLVSNFQTAFKPQITKSFAEKDFAYLNKLIGYSIKISFYLLFLVSLPIIMNIEDILSLWLKDVPQYTSGICVIFIIASLFNTISTPLWTCIFATGNIKKYQIVVSFAYIIELFSLYLFFSYGVPLVLGISIKAFLNFSIILITIYFVSKMIPQIDARLIIHKVIIPLLFISAVAYIITFFITQHKQPFFTQLVFTILFELFIAFMCYRIGLEHNERKMVLEFLKKKFVR